MDAHTSVAGQVSSVVSTGSDEITDDPHRSDVSSLEAKASTERLERSMLGWIFRIEHGNLDGLKIVPPMEIILFPDLMNRAWYRERLVPWIACFVPWETYLQYLEKFFDWNLGALHTLDAAIDLYHGLENEFVKSRAGILSDEESSLNGRIMMRIEEIKERKDCMSVDESRLATAGLMCIAAEAKVMSESTHADLSNHVRMSALDLMVNNGSGCGAACAALLGMTYEANLLLNYLIGDKRDDRHLSAEVTTCLHVRTRTLAVFSILHARDTAGNHDRDVAYPVAKPTRNTTVEDNTKVVDKSDRTQGKTKKKETIGVSTKMEDDLKESAGDKHRGKTKESKNMNRIAKAKALIKSVWQNKSKCLRSSS